MALPGLTVYTRRTVGVPNSNAVQRIPCIAGVASQGPIMQPRLCTSPSDVADFGYGEGPEMAFATGVAAGYPFVFIRLPTTTDGVAGAVTKVPAVVTASSLYSGLKVVGGASPNGDLFVTAKKSGVSIEFLGGNNGVLGVTVDAAAKKVTVQLGTNGGGTVTSTATQIAAHVNGDGTANQWVALLAMGDGTGIGAVLALTAIANGDLAYTPRQSGVTVAHVRSGNNTPLSVSVVAKAITVNLATDANGTPTSTATLISDKIVDTSAAALLVSVAAGGTGAGLGGVWSAQSITLGSAGSLTISGTPVDRFDRVLLEVVEAGTVGGATSPKVRWSLDRGIHWSPPIFLAANGILALSDQSIISGLTATFTGALDKGDYFFLSTSGPVANTTDMQTALTTASADAVIGAKWGFFASPTACSRAVAASVDALLQPLIHTRQQAALLQTREIASASATEVEADWRNSLQSDFNGYASEAGLVRVSAGQAEHQSLYTGRQYRRPAAFWATLRAAMTSLHEDLARVQSGPLPQMGEYVPGVLSVAGADANGGIIYRARVLRVSVQHVTQAGNSKPLKVAVTSVLLSTGLAYTITVTLGTDGGGVANSTATQVVAAVNAVLASTILVAATATGTGSGLVTAQTQPQAIPAQIMDHDEKTQQGLKDARFIALRTHDFDPGGIYFTLTPTMALANDEGWNLWGKSDVGLVVIRSATKSAFTDLNDNLATIPAAEGELVPKGAIVLDTARALSGKYSETIRKNVESQKRDGRPSVSPLAAGQDYAEVLRSNDYYTERKMKVLLRWRPLGVTETIEFTAQAQL